MLQEFYITKWNTVYPNMSDEEFGHITNNLLNKGISERFTPEKILELAGTGYPFMPSKIGSDEGKSEFEYSSLILIDIDDEHSVTNPSEVLESMKDICVGFFYTRSHGVVGKGTRYRLMFVLSETIKDSKFYEFVAESISKDLLEDGIPADKQSKRPMQVVRPSVNGHVVGNVNARLEVNGFKLKYDKHLKKQSKRDIISKTSKHAYIDGELPSPESIIELCVRSGIVEDFNDWLKCGYVLKGLVRDNHLTEEQGQDAFYGISDGNGPNWWEKKLKEPTSLGIGTLLMILGKDNNYIKREFDYALKRRIDNEEVELVRVEKHLGEDIPKELLLSKKKILLRSPTGSGKTYGLVSAAKILGKESKEQGYTEYYIFSVPTVAVCDQVASDFKILGVRGKKLDAIEKNSIGLNIRNYVKNGGRVITCTYDTTAIVAEILLAQKDVCRYPSLNLIVDEFHQMTHGYNYRKEAIDGIYGLIPHMKSFIGLSGTPDDVLRDDFEREIYVKLPDESSPCKEFGIYEYEKIEDEIPNLIQVIHGKVKKKKVRLLVFYQNKKKIKLICEKLKDMGVKAEMVTGDEKEKNKTYNHLIGKSSFPDDVDVVLTTSVLSDGLNIKNYKENYECIVVSSTKSRMFNIDQVKQCSNRFRSPYKAFYLFIQKQDESKEEFYNVEDGFNFLCYRAKNSIDYIKEEFKGIGNQKLFRVGIFERRFDITIDENDEFVYSRIGTRYEMSRDKDEYYGFNRKAYVSALEELIGLKSTKPRNADDVKVQYPDETDEVNAYLEEMKEVEEKLNENLKTNLPIVYTKRAHHAYQDQNEPIINEVKKLITPYHHAAIQKLSMICDYETGFKVVESIDTASKTYEYFNYIEALYFIYHALRIDRKEATAQAYFELEKRFRRPMNKDKQKQTIKFVNKALDKGKLADTNRVFNTYFQHTREKTTDGWIYESKPITISFISEKFGITTEQVSKSILEYSSKITNYEFNIISDDLSIIS